MKVINLTFVNGIFSAELSECALLPSDIHWDFSAGFLLTIPEKSQLSLHIKLMGDKAYTLTKKMVIGSHAVVSIMEEFIGDTPVEIETELQLNKAARLHYYKLQNKKTQRATFAITQNESSYLQLFFADYDTEHTSRTVRVKLQEPYAECHLQGLYYLTEHSQQVNNNILIEHIAKHGTSSMLFKGILDKQTSATFVGKVHVHPGALHTDAKQANHNLLLSKEAEVKTKPELEIYADDVKCAHGATVGQLDEDALFYLQARGIEKAQALQLLTRAFAIDIMHKIHDPVIKNYIQQRVLQYAEL